MSQALPARVRHGYGIAALALAVVNSAVMFFLLKYLVDGAGLSGAAAGFVIAIGKIWDAISDPLAGRLSDSTRSKMGPRRSWIAWGILPLTLAFASLWVGLPLHGAWAIAGYAVLLLVYSTAYTVVAVPYGALTPSLTSDYDERTQLTAARFGWSMLGGLAATVGMAVILEVTGGSWRTGGIVLSTLIAPPLLLMLWATRGRDHQRPRDAQGLGMWSVVGNRAFRRTAVLFVAAWSSMALLGAMLPFYIQDVMLDDGLLDLVLLAIQGSALLCIPLVVYAAARAEKPKAYAVSVVSWGAVCLVMAALPDTIGSWVVLLALLVGPGVAAAHVLPWSMLPDVIEADRVATGFDRTGSFYGVMTFLEKSSSAMAILGAGLMLDFTGFDGQAAVQTDSAIAGIRALIGPVPAMVLLGAAIFAWLAPPMTREAHKRLVEQLRAGS